MLSRVNALNGKGVPFFARGGIGFPNTTPSASLFYPPRHSISLPSSSSVSNRDNEKIFGLLLAKFDQVILSVEKNREVKFFRDKLADAYTSDDEDRKHAAWHL
jgi:hypothetical protein